jgi:PST family polysaccharide transporter
MRNGLKNTGETVTRLLNTKHGRLLSNTALLYLMTFTVQFCNFMTIPYLTRILGATAYGKVGLAASYMAYVQTILDFGFILSATKQVSEQRDDMRKISEIVTSVTLVKLLLGITTSLLFTTYVLSVASLKRDAWFYILNLLSHLVHAFLPDYYYRGVEQMSFIAFRSLLAKITTSVLVFILVRDEKHIVFLPVLNLTGNIVAVAFAYTDMLKRGIRFVRPPRGNTVRMFRQSLQYFASRISGTVYQATNTIILGWLYGQAPVVGHYTATEKVVTLVKVAASPIADSLFPYMVRNRNFRLIRKLLVAFLPVIILAVAAFAIFAEDICSFVFGPEYRHAGIILRLLSPVILVVFPTYIFEFPVMVPLGLTKLANLSNVFGLAVQLGLVVLTMSLGKLDIYVLCVITSVSEVSVFLFRLVSVLIKAVRIR